MATIAFKKAGDAILLIGGHGKHIGQSIYLREIFGREDGAPPPVDLAREKRHGDFVRSQIRAAMSPPCMTFPMAACAMLCARWRWPRALAAEIALASHTPHGPLFAEDQARYVVTCRPEQVEAVIQAAKAAGVPASWIGSVTGSAVAILGLATVPLARLRGAHKSWFPAFMAGEV